MADILKAIRTGETRPTRIMYRANLSWNPLRKLLKEMLKNGLIEAAQGNPHEHYSITPKGLRFLRAYRELEETSE